MPPLLFVHNSLRTFVRLDRDLLAERYGVREFCVPRNAQGAWATCQCLARLPGSQAVLVWFASYHALLPVLGGRLLGKRVVVCSSDYDLANEPQFHYGSMRGGLTKVLNNLIFRATTVVVVPSQFSRGLALANTVLAQTPDKVQVVAHGVPFPPAPTLPKQARVATVATLHRETNWRKGVDVFVQAARFLPAVTFDVIGGALDDSVVELRQQASPNVLFHGEVSDAERDRLLAQAGAYAQLSYMEGFGLAVAEAMLQQCVPVVTARGALPEVVGDCGVTVPYGDPPAAAQGIATALQQPALGFQARQRVLENFSLAQRAQHLQALLEN